MFWRKMIGFLDNWHWLWLVLAAPVMLLIRPQWSPILLVLPLILGCAWLAGKDQVASRGYTGPVPRTPLNTSILLLFFMVLVSLWATYDIAVSLTKVAGILFGGGVFFAVVRLSQTMPGWWGSFSVFVLSGVGIAGISLLGTNWFQTKLRVLNAVTNRLPGILSLPGAVDGFHPNQVAGSLLWVLPVLVVLAIWLVLRFRQVFVGVLSLKKWGTLVLVSGFGLFVGFVFLLTQSRGGYLGLLLAMIIVGLLALPARWRRWALGALAIVLVVLVWWLASGTASQVIDWLMGQDVVTDVVAENAVSLNTLESRVEIWSRAIYGIQDFAFTGMGLNTFREVVHVLYPLFTIGPDKDFGHAHNEFLQVALDLGVPGLVAFLGLYGGALWMLVDIWHKADPDKLWQGELLRMISLGLGGGLLAHALYGLTDAVALGAKPGFLVWMLLGLIAGLHRQVINGKALINE